MNLRPFRPSDMDHALALTIATFGPFIEGSFRSIVGNAVMANQHGNWREDYREMWHGLHDPQNNKHVVVAEYASAIIGFAAWQTDSAKHSGWVEIIAVAADQRRNHVGTALCAHAFDAMRQAGIEVVSIGTGGDQFHDAARAFYDSLGMTPMPLVRYYKAIQVRKSPMLTPYEELDAVLADLTGSVRDILGNTFVGAYLQGSFALGAGDLNSDCDFIIATTVPPTGTVESDLRHLHDEIPTRDGFWTRHLEGSYADIASLRGIAGLGVPWLYCDHGHRELIWDTHCNTLHTRWILRNRGVTMAGPSILDLVDEVPPRAMREVMREMLPEVMPGIRTWAPFDIAWTQRYIVSTYCRILYTLHTSAVASKREALEWARDNLDPKWRTLLTQVIQDRTLGWNPAEPPRPGSLEATYEFAAYAESFAR